MGGQSKYEEQIIDKLLNTAFSSQSIEVHTNFYYKDVDQNKYFEIDHCAIDRENGILIIFGDKSFKTDDNANAPSRALNKNVKQNVKMRHAILKGSKLTVDKKVGSPTIDIDDLKTLIQFNVIYHAHREDNGTIHIDKTSGIEYSFNFSDKTRLEYKQLIIGYAPLVRILEYCIDNHILFKEFMDIITKIYIRNANELDCGMDIYYAFISMHDAIKDQYKSVYLIIHNDKQNILTINETTYEFYGVPYMIRLKYNYGHFKDIGTKISKHIKLNTTSETEAKQILHMYLDKMIEDIDMARLILDSVIYAKTYGNMHAFLGTVIIYDIIWSLEYNDIKYILDKVVERFSRLLERYD